VRSLRAFLFLCVGLCLGGFSVFAFAAASDYGRSMKLNYPNSGQARPPGWYSQPRYDFPGAPDGWGHLRDINTLEIGGRRVDLEGVRRFGPRTLAKGALGLARALGPLGIGLTLADLVWDEAQGWLRPADPEQVNPWPEYAGAWYSGAAAGAHECATYQENCTFSDALQAYMDYLVPLTFGASTTYTITGASVSGNRATVYYTAHHPSWGDLARTSNLERFPGTTTCPAGMTLQGDICVGQGEPQPVTDQELEDAIYAELVARGMGSELARRLIEAGYTPTPDEVTGTGPSSVPGDSITSTTSGPAGTTSTTTNTTHNLNYNTNTTNNTTTVTITNTTTTTTTRPDGTTTTETTESAPEGQIEPPPQEKPFCELYPDASACAKLDVPATDPNESEDVTVTLTPTGGFGAEGGSCPPPFPFVVQGRSYQISYAQACDFFSAVRPVVIAAAMLSALLIALGGYKRD